MGLDLTLQIGATGLLRLLGCRSVGDGGPGGAPAAHTVARRHHNKLLAFSVVANSPLFNTTAYGFT